LYISNLQILRFRNLKDIQYSPNEGLNILIGDNAQGKTNFLEAVYFLSTGSSFRSGQEKDLISFGENQFSIQADYDYDDKRYSIALEYTLEKRKKITINNKNHSLFQDKLMVTLFTPDDLFLIKGAPQRRRSFLDIMLKRLSPEYKSHHENYEQLVSRRNVLLRYEPVNIIMLEALDQVFASTAAQVVIARLNILKSLEEATVYNYKAIGGKEDLRIKYALSFPLSPGKVSPEAIKNNILDTLQSIRSREIQKKITLIGPHRDDVNFYLDQKNARIFASQGQQRNLVVAVKMAELETFKRVRGSYPILLLDEVLAELDINRRDKILELLQVLPFQTFLTSVDISLFKDINGRIIRLDQGRLVD
jgi:DNA replication and repair protein RecF